MQEDEHWTNQKDESGAWESYVQGKNVVFPQCSFLHKKQTGETTEV